MSKTRASAILLAAVALAQIGPISAARAAEQEWNQKEVIRVADQLVVALDEANAASREAPPPAGELQQRMRDATANSFDRSHKAAADLVAKLRAGWDREKTEVYFRNVRDAVASTQRVARDAEPTERLNQKLHEVSELLRQLARFYRED
jgi:hypothetical protein